MICPHCGKETMALGNLCKHCGKEVTLKGTGSVKKRSTDGVKKAISSTLSAFLAFIFGSIGYYQYALKATEYPDRFTSNLNEAIQKRTAMTAYGLALFALCCAVEAIIMGSLMVVKYAKAEKTEYKKSVFVLIFGIGGIALGALSLIYAALAFFTVDFAYLGF